MLTLIVDCICPPIPTRKFDYAVIDENYEPGSVVGYGPTIQEALEDYLEMYEHRHDEPLTEWRWK